MASADLKFVQGPNVGSAGEALKGTLTDGSCIVSNGNDTGVTLWTFEMLYVPPGSALSPTTQGPGASPTFTFTPDVAGSYRFRLTTTDGATVDTVDIRNFCVSFPNGIIAAPYQRNPTPLPLTGVSGKADEMNIGGQPFGWDGDDDTSRILMYQALQILDGVVSGGEINTASNAGAGLSLFKVKTGVDLEFFSISAGADITINLVGSDYVIAGTAAGEVNTASNVGTGLGVFKQKAGVDLEFHELLAGTNVTITLVGDDLVIASSAAGTVTDAANIGVAGQGMFKALNGTVLEFFKLLGVNGFAAVLDTDQVKFGAITSDMSLSDNNLTAIKGAHLNSQIDKGNSGAAITIDFNDGFQQKVTLNDNAALTITEPTSVAANGMVLFVIQDGPGGRDPTFSANVKWSQNGLKPTFSTDPNAIDIIHFVADGPGDLYGFFAGDYA